MGCNNSSEAWNIQGPVDAATIEEYLELEKKIAAAEHNSPVLVLQQKTAQIAQLEERQQIQKIHYDHLVQITAELGQNTDLLGEDAGDDDGGSGGGGDDGDEAVKHNLLKLGPEHHKEAREALAAFNNKEIAKKELDNIEEQLEATKAEMEAVQSEAAELQSFYRRQDELLARIFGGDYGSVEENQFESELDHHEEMRNRIVEANFKWRQAQMMVDYAYKQLNEAVSKWDQVAETEAEAMEQRYGLASIARNNLVAAAHNILGAQRYLANVQLPYCAPSEVATLSKATAYIFTDMQTPERHKHAMECYSTTAKRCGALLQWINQVVNTTIAKDLEEINVQVKESSFKLRSERVRLIKLKAFELTGEDVDIAVAEIDTDVNVDLNLNDLARTEGIDPSLLQDLSEEDLAAIDMDELAPPPSKQDIFGKVEAFKTQYQEENEKREKQFAENEARIKNNLQQQLQERRQRRARKNMEEKEREHFTE